MAIGHLWKTMPQFPMTIYQMVLWAQKKNKVEKEINKEHEISSGIISSVITHLFNSVFLDANEYSNI